MISSSNVTDYASAAVTLFTWFWDKYGHDLVADTAKSAWNRVDWSISAHKYVQKIQQLYSMMRILGKNEPVVVGDLYTRLSILDKFTAQLRYDPEILSSELWERKSPQKNIERFDGMEVVKDKQYLFIVGRPGAGKSTFLRHVALEAINGKVSDYLPVMVELRDFIYEDSSIFDYLAKQFDVCDFPEAKPFIEHMLADGRLLVLFDGLDEVPLEQEKMRTVSRDIEKFVDKYSKNKYIITCRIAATDFKFERFTYVELAEFTSDQAKEFTNKWFLKKERYRLSFWCDLEESDNAGLLEMTRNPLLLTLLCLNYEVTQSFPSRRVEIYEEALDALLKTWDAERGIQRTGAKLSSYGKLSLGHKKDMFAELAATGFEKGQLIWKEAELTEWLSRYVASIPPEQDFRILDGRQILKDIEAQHAILIEQMKAHYSFAHLTFQEYYTANYFVAAGIQSCRSLIRKHLFDKRWHEVFLLVASKLPRMQADSFFDTYASHLRKSASSESYWFIDWITWIEDKCAGSYKNEFDALGARLLLAICSLQFSSSILINQSPMLELFCKLFNIPNAEDFHSLFANPLVNHRIIENNPILGFELLLFALHRDMLDKGSKSIDTPSSIQYYRMIRSLVDDILRLAPKETDDFIKPFLNEITNLSYTSQFRLLCNKVEQFLLGYCKWGKNIHNILYSHEPDRYIDSTIQCIECLDLSRVSNRYEIYRQLLTKNNLLK